MGFKIYQKIFFNCYFHFNHVFQSSHSDKLLFCCIYERRFYSPLQSLKSQKTMVITMTSRLVKKNSVNCLSYLNKELSKCLIQQELFIIRFMLVITADGSAQVNNDQEKESTFPTPGRQVTWIVETRAPVPEQVFLCGIRR